MKNNTLKVFALFGYALAGYFFYCSIKAEDKAVEMTKVASKQNTILSKELPALKSDIQKTSDIVNENQARDTSTDSDPREPSILARMDTAQAALNKQLKDQFSIERNRMRDSIDMFRGKYLNANLQLAQERSVLKNITIANVKKRDVPNKDAQLNFFQFPRQNHPGSPFSPVRQILRVTNNIDSGKVNGFPYYDYELNTNQRYELLFQVRSSWALGTNRKTVGAGLEMKLNNVSVNAVISYASKDQKSEALLRSLDPTYTQNRFPISFGLRYDFARILFK